MSKKTIKPVSIVDKVIFQVEAEEKETFYQAGDLQLIRVVDRYDWKNKTNHGIAVAVPDKLTDKVWATPVSYTKRIGRPEPVRRITSRWIENRIKAYKESLKTSSHNIETMDYFNHLVGVFRRKITRNTKYSPTNWVPKMLGHDVWKIEVQEGDTIYFDESALDDGYRMEYSKQRKPFYHIVYDQIIAYQRGDEVKTTAGHVLLEPIKEETQTATKIKESKIFSALGDKFHMPETVSELVETKDQGIVRYLPEHTINNEKIGCHLGDRVICVENATKKVRVNGKDYLRVKYREILAVMKESQ